MTLDEVATLFGKSRRQIMRDVSAGKLPLPDYYYPMSWNDRVIRDAHKRIKGANSGSDQRSRAGRSRRIRRARLARTRAASR
jgi:hypothetical protein